MTISRLLCWWKYIVHYGIKFRIEFFQWICRRDWLKFIIWKSHRRFDWTETFWVNSKTRKFDSSKINFFILLWEWMVFLCFKKVSIFWKTVTRRIFRDNWSKIPIFFEWWIFKTLVIFLRVQLHSYLFFHDKKFFWQSCMWEIYMKISNFPKSFFCWTMWIIILGGGLLPFSGELNLREESF